ncbi:hypothetical protein BXZ70DRAFT_541591 [Cristinia sonorae]|uniref:F-box domain-containing protein n=1 Tax=Cristinia sonorae TaxID=1940300 RepID=A0A8K0UGS5_9AGAR|nr:hypothetical protein BXZ70DRAFT_541591 [Cristinia sonorae]
MSYTSDDTLTELNLKESSLTREVAKLLKELAHVRCQINAYSLASRLPPEVLLEFFFYVLWGEKDSRVFQRMVATIPQVCRLWKHTALSCQTLWTHIRPWSEPSFSSLAHRSAKQPLHVFINMAEGRKDLMITKKRMDNINGACQAIQHHTIRVTTLDLTLTVEIMENFAELLGCCRWDLLESLSLAVTMNDPGMSQVDLRFASHPPQNLRHLTLRNIFPLWNDGGIFKNIRELHLHGPSGDPSYLREILPTTSEALDLLESCPTLEELGLYCWGPTPLPDHATTYPDPERSLKLPSGLRSLFIEGSLELDIAHLLANLVIPATTKVRLAPFWTIAKESHRECSGLLSSLPIRQPDHSLLSIASVSTISVSADQERRLDVPLEISASRRVEQTGFGELSLCVQREGYYSLLRPNDLAYEKILLNTLLELGQVFQSSTLRTLHLSFPVGYLMLVTEESWQSVLQDLTSLTSLRYRRVLDAGEDLERLDFDVETLLPLLGAICYAQHDDGDSILPKLELLNFDNLGEDLVDALIPDMLDCIEERRLGMTTFQLVVDGTPLDYPPLVKP